MSTSVEPLTARAPRRALTLVGVGILSFLGCIDLTIVNTAAPAISRDLHSSVAQTQLVVNVFVVALAMFMVTAGRLSDLLGRRRVLFAGAVVFAVASSGAAVSGGAVFDGVVPMVIFRFAQGLACAVLYTSCTTVVADAFPADQRGRAVGALFAVNGIGLAIGPLLGGVTVVVLGWPWVFGINVPLVALALCLCAVSVPRSYPVPGARLDLPGAVTLAVGLAGLIAALTFNSTYGWTSPFVISCLLLGALALVALPLVESRRADPLIPFSLLTNQLFLAAVIAEAALAFFYTTALFLMPLYLTVARGLTELAVGLAMLPATASVAVLSPVAGRLVDRFGPRPVLVTGFLAFAASGLLQSRLGAGSPCVELVVAFVLMGVGWALVLGPSAVTALSAVPKDRSGLAVGATWTFHNVGGAVGLAVSLTVFRAVAGSNGIQDLPVRDFVNGYGAAMLLIAVTSLIAATTILRLARPPRAHCRSRSHQSPRPSAGDGSSDS